MAPEASKKWLEFFETKELAQNNPAGYGPNIGGLSAAWPGTCKIGPTRLIPYVHGTMVPPGSPIQSVSKTNDQAREVNQNPGKLRVQFQGIVTISRAILSDGVHGSLSP